MPAMAPPLNPLEPPFELADLSEDEVVCAGAVVAAAVVLDVVVEVDDDDEVDAEAAVEEVEFAE